MKFDERVYETISQIPRGKVTTYKQIAQILNTKAYRAVGQSLKRNPKPIEVPCHRVVSSSGELGGYGGKLNSRKKSHLLRKEGVEIKKGKIDLDKFMHKFKE
jgi:methylated-DNA-[protein]-cysteine S-methyltransferase